MPGTVKVTVPVGVPDPGEAAVTVAVKVTVWPTGAGFCDDDTVVVVLAWATFRLTGVALLPTKLPYPLKAAAT